MVKILETEAIFVFFESEASEGNSQFFELFHFANALSDLTVPQDATLKLCVLADGIASVLPDDSVDPTQSLILGPARVIPKELPFVQSSIVA